MSPAVAQHDRQRRARRAVDVVARDRPRDAHQLHLSGLDWTTIAERTGYKTGRIAKLAVDAYLQKVAVELAPEHRLRALELELQRLAALQAAFWEAAMIGDRNAAEVVLKVIARRCRILGFDKPDDTTAGAPRTIVIGGTSEQYIAGLKAIISDH